MNHCRRLSQPALASEMCGILIAPCFAYHSAVKSDARCLRVTHPFFTWWWCDCGQIDLRLLETRSHLQIRQGQWVLIPPYIEREHAITDDTVIVSISFYAFWPTGLPLLELVQPMVITCQNKLAYAPLRRKALAVCRAYACEQVRRRASDPLHGLAVCGLQGQLYIFISELFGQAVMLGAKLNGPGSGDSRLDAVLSDMRTHLAAGPLPMTRWSRIAGLSRSQLDRLAQQRLGMSLRQHRDRWLVDAMYQQLSTGGDSIKQLAAAYGFVDSAHLCHWVRQQTNRSPLQIRRSAVT